MKMEDCKVGLKVFVNYPGQRVDNFIGNVVDMKDDKVYVALQCFGGKVLDFDYSNIESALNQAAKFFYHEGDMVTICQPDSKANGCFGMITEKLSDKAVVKLDDGDEVTDYYIKYENLIRGVPLRTYRLRILEKNEKVLDIQKRVWYNYIKHN